MKLLFVKKGKADTFLPLEKPYFYQVGNNNKGNHFLLNLLFKRFASVLVRSY